MKTLHTIYNNFAKRVALILTLLSTIGTTAVWGADIATRTIYNDPPLECTTTPTTLETGKPVTYCFSNCDITSSDAGLDWYNGITLTIEVPSEYNIAQITIEPYASSDLKDVVLQTTGVEGTITNVDKFVWTASDQITQTIPQIVLKQSNSSGQSTRIKSISVTYQSSTMSTITWKVDGETYTEGNPSFAIANGEQIGVLPTIPDNCNEDMLFVGWTADENNPANYFYDAVSSPIITTSTTFHAVYASIAEEFAGEKKNTLFAEDVIYDSTNDGYQSFTAETHAGTWTGKGVYNSDGYIQINNGNKDRYIGSPEFSGTVKTITITTINNPTGSSSTADKIYYICSSNTAIPSVGDLGQYSTTYGAATFTIDISSKNANQFYIYVNRAVYITKVEVTYKDHTYKNHTTICSPDVTVTLNPNGADSWTDNTINDWDGPDGDGYYSKTQEKNTDFILPTPTRTGYDFGGWEDDKGSAVSSPYETKSNVTLTAQWTPLKYNIIYRDQGDVAFSGENAASLPNTHTYGTPTTLVDGEKTGYTFGGWYDNSNCTGTALEELAADTYINAITLYAKWTANTYTVHFNANGGEGTMTEQVFTYDVSQPLSENSFTWEGYNFNGWNTQANGGGDSYADKESVSNLTSEPNGEITLFAQWTLKELENYRTLCTYAIILENNYTNPDNNTLDGSATIVATHTSFTSFIAPAARAGYVIEGYYAEPECNTKVVNSDGTLISNVPNYTDADGKWIGGNIGSLYTNWQELITPTLQWSADSYTATLEADNEFPTLDNPENLSPIDYTSLNETVATIDVNGNITLLAAGTTDITASFAGDDTYKPASDTYTLTVLDANCVWMEVGNDVSKIVSGSEVVITAEIGGNLFAIPNDGGNTAPIPIQVTINDILSGIVANNLIWDVEKDGSNNLIFHPINTSDNLFCNAADDGVRIGSTQQNAQKNHEFKINGNYLQNVITSRYLGTGSTSGTIVWKCYTSNTGVISKQSLKIFQRICLDSEHYWVTWDAAGGQFADGSGVQMKDFAVGAAITHPATNPTREGYTFAGWSPSTTTMPNQNITFTAQWQVNQYTVTWNANGGKFGNETSVEQSYSYGATITAPTPTRTGYTFAGWDSEVPATMPARNLTYNAQWNCTSPTDIKINGAYIVFPGETIELTVTGDNIADDATYQWYKKNGENYDELVGQTTNTLRIDNCVVGDAANYKCVVTNGACSAENNFTVKMYRLRGLTDPENSWTTDFVFSKAEGKTATYEITLNGGSNYKFKVHDGSAYYGNNEGGDNPNPTMTHDNCTNWTMQENKGYNVILQTTITGVYTFVLDYTDESNPTISVIYPKKKIIYLNPNIWDAGNATEYYTVYSWGTAGSEFVPMELADCNGEVYMAEIDAAHTQVIFIRYERHVTNFDHKWNQTVDIPLDANNPQYRIDGWENNSNDKKSYGGWEQYTPYYSISYNMNGHGQSIGDICIKKDDIWIAPDDPSEVGYTFLGWRRPAETGDNTLYKKGVTGFPVVSDEELTAQWSFSMEYAITGTAYITSAVGQTIKATTPLTLAVSNMPVGTKVAISAPNITFYDEAGNAITEVATKYNPEQFNLTIAYTPTVENTTEQPTITLSVLGNEKTFDGLISARSLPNIFAIVAKVGNIWYALPSQGLNSTDDLMGYAIEVDNQDDPTLVTNVPANADWSLRQVYAGQNANATKDRFKQYGNNLVFVNSDVKALNASSTGSHVLTDAQYTNYYDQYPERYEWTPTTTDLETYQLTNAGRTNRKLSIDILTRFGVYAGEITDMRFLRIQDRYTLAALQVVEWKENSVVIMYNGDPAQTATLAINGTEQVGTTTLNSVQKDIAIYELPANGIANKAAQRLCITIGTSKKWLTIPYIINGSQTAADVLTSTSTTKAVAAVTDVVVLDGATFTAAGNKNDKYTFRTIHVYGGGKLVVPASATEGLGIYSLILRSGTVENGTYTNSYPQLVMNGKYSNTSGIYLDYITTYERYYALSVPYPVKTKNIKYPADIYGDNLKSGNTASFALQYYDGAARATGASGWKDFDESGDDPTLTPYQGYTFWGAPRKVSVNGGTAQRPKFGIHRIQLTGVGAEALLESETKDKTIDITAHPADRPNDIGWNFLGNPYLAQYGGLSADNENVQVGLLEQEMVDGRWTGGWKHTGNLRYITITTDGQTYTPVEVDKATFSPFNTFFIQAAKDGALQFAWASRAQNAPARHYAAQQETVKEITTGIILTGNDQTDRTGLLIADNFTEEYDYNADLSKFENSGINLYTIGKTGNLAYMAINQTLAEQPIPVGYTAPAEGLYTIAFDEDRYNATDISALYLIDYDSNEKTNLLHTDYSFVTAAGTNNQRFALQVAFAPENATNVEWVGDATIQVGVEGNTLMLNNLPTDAAVHIFDALGRLMYHAPTVPTEMQLTLPTGYYLVRIADKQNAVVIKTVIP